MGRERIKVNIEHVIIETFKSVFFETYQEHFVHQLSAETILLDTGLDSLGFAILVVRLEESLGFDPFVSSSEAYYPRTFGDLIAFYESNQPK